MNRWVLATLVFTAATAHADVAPPTCFAVVTQPTAGASNIAADAELAIAVEQRCTGLLELRPTLTNGAGQPIPFDLQQKPSASTDSLAPALTLVKPRTALLPGAYVLDPGTPAPSRCDPSLAHYKGGPTPGPSRFTVGPAPSVRGVSFVTDGVGQESKVAAVYISLSEDVARDADLSPSAGLVAVELVGGETPAVRDADYGSGSSATRSFKVDGYARESLPSASATIRIRVGKSLAFASGAALSEDFVAEVVPARFPYGWKPGDEGGCDFGEDSETGCTTGAGGLSGGFGAMLALFALGRRRR